MANVGTLATSWAWLLAIASSIHCLVSIDCSHILYLSSRLHACGGWIFVGDISKAEVGGALPRWRPPPHSRLPDLKFKLKSLLRVHEIKGIRLEFGSLHAEFVFGLRLLAFLYKGRLLELSMMEILGMNTLPKLL